MVHALLLVFQEPRELVDGRPDVGGRVQLASTWTGGVEERGENVRRLHDLDFLLLSRLSVLLLNLSNLLQVCFSLQLQLPQGRMIFPLQVFKLFLDFCSFRLSSFISLLEFSQPLVPCLLLDQSFFLHLSQPLDLKLNSSLLLQLSLPLRLQLSLPLRLQLSLPLLLLLFLLS